MVAKYWLEGCAGLPCDIEVASEFRYRSHVVSPNTLFVTISQSGETADTLAALRDAKEHGYAASLAICNVPESSLVRESDMTLMTRAGPEIGVASTKAFTTQLTALLLLAITLGRYHKIDREQEVRLVQSLRHLPKLVEQALQLEPKIEKLAERFVDKQHTLFLGRGMQYPIAQEGALKLKEISYIHAEAYPAGELKHGPLALVDEQMPVVAVAPKDDLVEKLKSNLQEVRARGGVLYVFADDACGMKSGDGYEVFSMPEAADVIAPILYTVPLQLLAYHVAVMKGTDVDQPRNLAKSVTVE
jgi:glucosamine--fructose-6-phosphate aminotransferase (isomerizing)